jgi:ATP-dependent helicase HrpA
LKYNKSQIIQKINDCKISDQFKFKRRLDRIRSDDQLDALNQLQIEISKSSENVEAKRKLNVGIHYPDLPISNRREEVANKIKENQVIILAGETGSGKTTQLPKICLELGYGCKGLIGHTQPRRLAARAVADRIAEELNTTLGERVGYQIRFHEQVGEDTQIKLMTDGILLAETQHDKYLEKYDVLIIDEAHERSLNIDFLLGYISRILPKRPDLKVIITSATIDLERFSKHFNNAPIIEVSGRVYPVEVLYRPLEDSENNSIDMYQGILSAVEEISDKQKHNFSTSKDGILVFLSGEKEIRETAEVLRKADLRNTEILPLYSRLSVSDQQKIFGEKSKFKKKMISTVGDAKQPQMVLRKKKKKI